jgi:hypothetical protein
MTRKREVGSLLGLCCDFNISLIQIDVIVQILDYC